MQSPGRVAKIKRNPARVATRAQIGKVERAKTRLGECSLDELRRPCTLTCSLGVHSRPARPRTRLVTSTSGSRRHLSGDSGFATVLDRRSAVLGGDEEPQHELVEK